MSPLSEHSPGFGPSFPDHDGGELGSEYFLTNVDLTPSPNDGVTTSQMTSSRDHILGEEDELSNVSLNTENATFDPFTEFKVKSSVDNTVS